MIKLYTEEQVRKIYDLAFINLDQDGCHIIDEDEYFKQILKTLTPIELPSDEEIAYEVITWNVYNMTPLEAFRHGVNWMKQQILNQNK